ncbi:MAG: N,N-dimethylformamidase beta subunit family domain-containing protein, partial [Microbacterium sp.]
MFTFVDAPAQAAGSPCGADINPIACENSKPGTDPETWDIQGAGDPSIQGFATDISVNAGDKIDFKIDTDAAAYTIDVYRTGWYQGLGARFIQSVPVTATLPQVQPECISDIATELYDCGTWGVSASWNVPTDAVSGVYVAKLIRSDDGGASHIIFIVRNDGSHSDVVFQTSDPTWHAYNTYGGSDFYQGAANGRAYKISYNRPFATRGGVEKRDFYFSAEYATVRFLERNGYDMTYIAGVDTDRRGEELLNHNVFLSVGHDEYWSGAQRANMEAARDAGVNMQFLSGNEGYWRTRYEPSVDDSATPYRTLVSYKETWSNAKIDPSTEWTGTWRDPRFADAAEGGHLPENALTGTIYMVNDIAAPVTVTSDEGKLRLWRNTGLDEIPAGRSEPLGDQTVGYESDEDIDNGFRPEGLIRLSTTITGTTQYLLDYGNTVAAGTTEHHITLYRAASGALVFSAGSVQWGWGLDSTHDGVRPAADPRMQQAEVNLLADMGAQPTTLMDTLAPAAPSTDTTAPTTTITAPADGAQVAHGAVVTVTGTAADADGRVAGVEVSTDGGESWHPATGTTDWTYSYIQQGAGQATIIARAIDDSANFSSTGTTRAVAVSGPFSAQGQAVPALASSTDTQPVELGQRFSTAIDGFVSGVRFYKGANNLGTHTGSLWSADGERLATVTFVGETPTGWQTALFDAPVAVTASTDYVISYTAPQGGYAYVDNYWPYQGRASTPVIVTSGVGSASPGLYGHAGSFPTMTWGDSNYYVDVVFESVLDPTVRIAARQPAAGSSSIPTDTEISAVFTADVIDAQLQVTDADGATVAGTNSYDPGTRKVRFAPAAVLDDETTYSVTIQATPADGAEFDAGAAWSFTTAAPTLPEGQCPCSIYTDQDRPLISADADQDAVTLGTRFTVDQSGLVTAVRFYKGFGNDGTHVGTLWTASGQKLGEVTFTGETSSGWQTAEFTTPIALQPDTEYVVSYRAPQGHYSVTPSTFADGYARGPITVPANGGVFTYGAGMPTQTTGTSYFVDVVFATDIVGPALTATTP